MKEKILEGVEYEKAETDAIDALNNKGFVVDYLNVCNSKSLEPATSSDKELVILAAAMLGKTRLIDNIELSLK
jgi:pantoate--beta-alanine ligase